MLREEVLMTAPEVQLEVKIPWENERLEPKNYLIEKENII